MCAPIPIALAGLAITAGSEIAGHLADKKAEGVAREASISAFLQDVSGIVSRVTEERDVAAQRIQQGFQAGRRARSTARTAAGEAGVGGFSVDLLLSDVDRQLGEFSQSNLNNLELVERQAGRELASAGARRDARIAASKAPSFLGRGIRIAGAGIQTFTQLKGPTFSAGKGGKR